MFNQEELCDNVIRTSDLDQLGFKKEPNGGVDMGIIHDFTLIDFQYLVLLMGKDKFLVFDCQMVLE